MAFYHDGELVLLQVLPLARTDTDLYVYFENADVILDVFFNGFYPLVGYSTGGTVNGYVDGTAKMITVAKDSTKVIPGHGPLSSKADLVAAHDMLALRDRVAAKPSAEFDAKWGKSFFTLDMAVSFIDKSLP